MTDLKKVSKEAAQGKPSQDEKINLKKEEVKTSDYTLEIIRDYYGNVDPFYLSKKDPKYAYRFLRDDPKNINIKTGNLLFQKGGWQICPREHLLKLGMKEKELAPDGLCRRGDTILAFLPKELFDEKEKYKTEQANIPIKQIKRLIKQGDPSVGGKDIHDTMQGIQTQKQLGM